MSKQKFIYILIILLSLANLPVYAGLQSGTITSTGTITAATFVGSGSSLTGLLSSQITDLTTTYLSLSSATATYSPKASPTFTGNVTMPGTGIWNSSGNVGLGTTSPAEKLQISNGAIRLDRGQLIKWGQNGESTDDANITVTQETSDQTNMRFRIGDVSDANDNFIFQRGNNAGASGTELMRINAAGNVGIGTTSPTTKLNVVGTLSTADGTNGYMTMNTNGSATKTGFLEWRLGNGTRLGYMGDGSNSIFMALENSANFTINGGNVGIGTTSPLTRLHVVDSVSETQFRLENTNASGKAYYRANSANSTVNATFGTDTAGGFFWVETNHPFKIATNGSERLKIDTSGNVGIGTTSPDAKLVVAGAIKRDGSTMYGTNAATHINLGTTSTTGTNGSNYSYATIVGGLSNTATGDYPTVGGGWSNTASWAAATVGGGQSNTASSSYSTVSGGMGNVASGAAATIPGGYFNTATGCYSTAMGYYTTAQTLSSLVIGQYNIVSGSVNNWVTTDPLFVIGNGTADGSRSNAMTVLKSGNVGIGTTSPSEKLEVNGKIKITNQTAGGVVPPGSVFFFAAATPPSGYLECNGAAISRTTYADLYAVTSTTFGAGDGSTTFNLPDLRGQFLRGYDNGRGVDSSRTFGSAQSDVFKSHNHSITDPGHTHVLTGRNSSDGNGVDWGQENYDARAGGVQSATTGITINNTGDTETRPKNVALLPCIKY